MESKGKDEIEEMTSKMQKMDEMLNKEIFSNPIKEVQEKMRQDLLEFKKIYLKNLSELKTELANNKASFGTSSSPVEGMTSEEINDLKVALEHKKYQVEILKKEFTNYENKTEEEINSLKTENSKLKYRISILLKTIEELESKSK